MDDKTLSHSIRSEVQKDLRPVRPLLGPWRRALIVVVSCLALGAVVLLLAGLRQDYAAVGGWLIWSSSLIQLAAAYSLAAVALRMVIPGRLPSPAISAGVVCLAVLAQAAISLFFMQRSPTAMAPGQALRLWMVCSLATFALGLAPCLAAFGLGIRGVPLRPRLFGLLCGLAAGLGAEAAWRLHCPYSDPAHVFGAHGGAILILTITGALAGVLWSRSSERR